MVKDRLDDDEDTIIDFPESPPKPLSKAKLEQLSSARVKAIESRRKSQKAALQSKLHEVKLLLGDFDGQHIERVQEAMMTQERELRRKQNELTTQLIRVVRDESAKREAEHDSLKRTLHKLRSDIQDLKQSRSIFPPAPQSTVSSAASSKIKIPLAQLSSKV